MAPVGQAWAQALDGGRASLYLHTSPEFACKKLLAAGEPKIVTFARTFRNRERSALHHPEFTLLEWYRANEPYETLMADCAALLAASAKVTGLKHWIKIMFKRTASKANCQTVQKDVF